MGEDIDLSDPKLMALHKLYRPERVTPAKRGVELLKTPGLNKVSSGYFFVSFYTLQN